MNRPKLKTLRNFKNYFFPAATELFILYYCSSLEGRVANKFK